MHESRRVPAMLLLALLLAPASVAADESGSAKAAEQLPEKDAALLAVDAAEDAADAGQPSAEAVQQEDRPPTGMDRPLDGSSVDSFNEGLAQVEQEVTAQEFQKLKAAIEKLLFYDIGAKRNREVLYQRLSGKTPTQIIEQASR